MAKHDGVAGPARVRIPALLLGCLVVGAIVLGSWWALGSPSDPIDQNPVQALAFVASSPSCVDGGDRAAGGRLTVVDVVGGASPVRPVRTTVDACGYRDGQQVAVEYLAGDISRARLSGTNTAGDTGSAGRLLPIGLLVAGLLAAAATIGLVADGRRSRRRRGADESATARHARISGAEFLLFERSEPAASSRPVPAPVRRPATAASVAATPPAVPARLGRHAFIEADPPLEVPAPSSGLAAVDLFFLYADLSASLHDELFTHRRAPVSSS